jgi:chromosome segregation protein
VTLDGQVINAGGSYTGGYTARQGGVFTRKNEIEKLEERVEQLKRAALSARRERDAAAREVSELEAEITALHSDQITGSEDRIRAEGEAARLKAENETAGGLLGDAEAELAAISASRTEKNLLISGNEGKISVLEAEIARMERAAGDETQSGDEFMARRSLLTSLLGEHKIARVEKQKDIEGIEQAVERLSRQSDAASGRAGTIAAEIERIKAENAVRTDGAEAGDAEAAGLRAAALRRRADIEGLVAARAEAEREIVKSQAAYGEMAKQREDVGREISRLEERKVSLQGEYDLAVARLWEEYELTRPEAEKLRVPFETITELRQQVGSLRARIKALGTVNLGAIEELKEVTERFDFLSAQVADVESSRDELIKLIAQIEGEMTAIFNRNFTEINNRFRVVFVELFGGGSARLSLTDETDVLESGIEIDVQPPGKVIKNLASLSGGEQALVAIALYFSILSVNPSPFCILDEIDSALDEANVNRFAAYLRRVMETTQIIAITHRRGTMEAADALYGVTMQEEGVSRLLKLGVEEAQLVVTG